MRIEAVFKNETTANETDDDGGEIKEYVKKNKYLENVSDSNKAGDGVNYCDMCEYNARK